MNLFLAILLLIFSNSMIYSYLIVSGKMSEKSWSIFLIPLVLLPVFYLINLAFAGAFILGPKDGYSIAAMGILNIAIWTLVVVAGHVFYFKEALDLKMILGLCLVLVGAVLVSWKS